MKVGDQMFFSAPVWVLVSPLCLLGLGVFLGGCWGLVLLCPPCLSLLELLWPVLPSTTRVTKKLMLLSSVALHLRVPCG